jgi:predicted pyridoxine 5'-phosphate oxidase superfamily flavin-nucleotide-binding protein
MKAMTDGPFHAGELEAQIRAGQSSGGAGIRGFMPDQHRLFFAQLPWLFLGVLDARGWPLATVLTGAPGFVESPSPTSLAIRALPQEQDPAAGSIRPGRRPSRDRIRDPAAQSCQRDCRNGPS